ncbi:MAG: UDP-N-acetylmuramoyl-L-alanyl-D-glutamate--2,6-diaminopimelate ligase [Gammaproteobacteria bacterium]|nr:UDP-N-acetylmuramoyl-L-alanyl-D-glutamate--2,6-diaminopimelate ligase [Gammaproteobacteria bacterium]
MRANQGRQLSELLEGIIPLDSAANSSAKRAVNCTVHGLTLDSRKVTSGDVFLACAGHQVHGVYFAPQAIKQGAVAVLVEDHAAVSKEIDELRASAVVPVISVPNLTRLAGVIAERFYDHPSKALTAVGITGTNGKTSCSQFLAQALSEDKPCGIVGTIGNGLYGKLENASHTTPDAVTLHGMFMRFLQQGAASVVMEVSSHGLVQGRVAGVSFDVAVFTNLSRDHLDYHGDMENYSAAKKQLFQMPGLQHAVINADDVFGRQLIKELPAELHTVGYGVADDAQVRASQLRFSPQGMMFYVDTPWGGGTVQSALLGRFNVSNILAVLATLLVLGTPLENALRSVQRLTTVSGRMERVGYEGHGPVVVVDYAHTPDAVEKALTGLREHFKNQQSANGAIAHRIFCVFGCGGDRDKGKRAAMGASAQAHADTVIITNDNPRTEDPNQIVHDIMLGVTEPAQVQIILDRREAIRQALQQATANDAVIVLGKGHEQYQILGEERRPYAGDYAVAAEIATQVATQVHGGKQS